jgi:hypothetical protein
MDIDICIYRYVVWKTCIESIYVCIFISKVINENIYTFTDSLSCALRHVESAPRLASKYVSAPALFKGMHKCTFMYLY